MSTLIGPTRTANRKNFQRTSVIDNNKKQATTWEESDNKNLLLALASAVK
jgi:hypothetical protein